MLIDPGFFFNSLCRMYCTCIKVVFIKKYKYFSYLTYLSDMCLFQATLYEILGRVSFLFFPLNYCTSPRQAVFLRRDLIWYCSLPETDSYNARPGTQFRTKGAIATAFILFGTSFLFVNSHLTAHEENIKDRIQVGAGTTAFYPVAGLLNRYRYHLPHRTTVRSPLC